MHPQGEIRLAGASLHSINRWTRWWRTLLTSRFLRGLVGFLGLGVVAEAITRAGLVHPYYLPSATQILRRSMLLTLDASFLSEVFATLQAVVFGLSISAFVAIPLGIILGTWDGAYKASRALVEFFRPIPSVALIPPAILLFGTGLTMKVALIVAGAVWPILYNSIYGIHAVDSLAKDTARVFGYGGFAILRRVSLPSAAPFMYTGIRIASAIAVILAISAELLAGSQQGIGSWLVFMSQAGVAPEYIYAGTLLTGVLGLLISAALLAGERRLVSWEYARAA